MTLSWPRRTYTSHLLPKGGASHLHSSPRPRVEGTWSDPEAQPRLLQGPHGHPDQVSMWRPPCPRTSPHPLGAQRLEPSQTSQPLWAAGPEAPRRTSPMVTVVFPNSSLGRVVSSKPPVCKALRSMASGWRSRTSEGTLPGDVCVPRPAQNSDPPSATGQCVV